MKKSIVAILAAILLLFVSCEETQYVNVNLYDQEVLLETIPVVYGSYAPCKEAPAKEGLAFVRWENPDGSAYDFSKPVEEETNLYAKYGDICVVKGHDLVHHEAKAATCTEDGWKAYDTCSRCDYTTYQEVKAFDHDLIHHEAKTATCTEIGCDAYDTCSRCNYTTFGWEKLHAPIGHDLVHHEAKEATCQEIGWDAYDTCTRCDYSTYVAIKNHNYSSTHICKTCGYCEYFSISEDGVLTLTSTEGLSGSIVIPEGVVEIQEDAFRFCKGSVSVTCPSTLKTIGKNAFKNCCLESITLSSQLETIEYGAFEGTKITSIDLPSSLKTLGEGAFYNCGELKSIVLPASVTSFGTTMFFNCISLASATLPSNMSSIPSSFFSYCEKLETVNVPNSVTSIGDDAFFDCGSLTAVILPANLENIGSYAFANCGLTSLEIPASVESIGDKAFNNDEITITINNTEGAIDGAPWGAKETSIIVYSK